VRADEPGSLVTQGAAVPLTTEGSGWPRTAAAPRVVFTSWRQIRTTPERALASPKRMAEGVAIRCPGRWRGCSGQGAGSVVARSPERQMLQPTPMSACHELAMVTYLER
jgi:hypothetical protein